MGGYCYNLSKPTQVSLPESPLFFQTSMLISRLRSNPDYPAAGLWSALLFSNLRRMNLNRYRDILMDMLQQIILYLGFVLIMFSGMTISVVSRKYDSYMMSFVDFAH